MLRMVFLVVLAAALAADAGSLPKAAPRHYDLREGDGTPKAFRDYKLDAPTVKAIIDRRYGGMRNLPLDETVVSPGDLAASKLLAEVPVRTGKKH